MINIFKKYGERYFITSCHLDPLIKNIYCIFVLVEIFHKNIESQNFGYLHFSQFSSWCWILSYHHTNLFPVFRIPIFDQIIIRPDDFRKRNFENFIDVWINVCSPLFKDHDNWLNIFMTRPILPSECIIKQNLNESCDQVFNE